MIKEHRIELEFECCAGCQRFTCGSIKHLKECENYKDSQAKLVDKKQEKIGRLEELIFEVWSSSEGIQVELLQTMDIDKQWKYSLAYKKMKDIQEAYERS